MSNIIEIKSVNISDKKGTIKKPVDQIILKQSGIVNDAHSGNWHRQVSMLGIESLEKFSMEAGRNFSFGEFAENLTTRGMEIFHAGVFDRFIKGTLDMEVTQIGKKCHGVGCSIYQEVGHCIMPMEGIFLRVISGGNLKPGDTLTYMPKTFRIKVITISDRASKGIYEDKSGPKIAELSGMFFKNANRLFETSLALIPDDPNKIATELTRAIDEKFDVVFTTGGTGIGPRDYTVDVVKPMLKKEIPGIMELIRVKYGKGKPNALLSRSVAGIIEKSLVYTLPGSTKAVSEYTEEIFKTMNHAMLMLHGIGDH